MRLKSWQILEIDGRALWLEGLIACSAGLFFLFGRGFVFSIERSVGYLALYF